MALYYYQVWILQRVNQHLRLALLDRLQSLSLRFHADSKVGDAIYRMYQDSAMVTQLIEVLFLAPLYGFARFVFGVGTMALFDPFLALLLVLLWPPLLALGLWFSRRLRVRFRAPREATSGAHLAHPGDPRGHPRDQGLRRRARRAAALRGGEPRRLRRRLRRAQQPRDLPGDPVLGGGRGDGRVRRVRGAAHLAGRRHRRGGPRLHGLEPRPVQLREGALRRRRRLAARAVPHLGPDAGHRDRPRPRVRDARSRARGARRCRARSRCRRCAAACASATCTSATRRTAPPSRASTSRRASARSPRSSARPARARRR